MKPTRLPGEFSLIVRYFAPLSLGFPGAYGLLDDVALIRPSAGCELVAKTDAVIGGIDFPTDEAADQVARKALRVNLSDLAAKGAVPRAYMLDLMLPDSIDEPWIAAFAAGLQQDQAEYRIHLIGGDMSGTPGPVTIAIMAFGEVPIGKIIRRGGARAGDAIYVTGTIGDAVLGLAALRGTLAGLDQESAAFLVNRYRQPRPRVALGPKLIGIATASVDVSDGLVADLRHICEVSKLGAVVEASRVPLSAAGAAALTGSPELLSAAFTGGDDYEILFTAAPDSAAPVAEVSRSVGIPVTCIGLCMRRPKVGPRSRWSGKMVRLSFSRPRDGLISDWFTRELLGVELDFACAAALSPQLHGGQTARLIATMSLGLNA